MKTVNPGRLRVLLPKFGGSYPIRNRGRRTLMAAYCAVPRDGPFAISKATLAALAAELAGPAAAGLTACELEELLDERERRSCGSCCRTTTTCGRRGKNSRPTRPCLRDGTNQVTRTRLETGHVRLLATLFCTVKVTRCAWRKPGAGNWRPADAALSLPAGRHSHSLARLPHSGGPRLVRRRARRGYPPVRAGHRQAAARAGRRRRGRRHRRVLPARIPKPCTAGTLLVLSADCKGT